MIGVGQIVGLFIIIHISSLNKYRKGEISVLLLPTPFQTYNIYLCCLLRICCICLLLILLVILVLFPYLHIFFFYVLVSFLSCFHGFFNVMFKINLFYMRI